MCKLRTCHRFFSSSLYLKLLNGIITHCSWNTSLYFFLPTSSSISNICHTLCVLRTYQRSKLTWHVSLLEHVSGSYRPTTDRVIWSTKIFFYLAQLTYSTTDMVIWSTKIFFYLTQLTYSREWVLSTEKAGCKFLILSYTNHKSNTNYIITPT